MLQVYVENHKTRDPSDFVALVRADGQEPVVMTDHSDHYLRRGKGQGQGCFANYMRILKDASVQPQPWAVVLQDDVSIPPGLFARMAYILERSPGGAVAFYVPQNKLYTEAQQQGKHVVEAYWNYWIQAMAWKKTTAAILHGWGEQYCVPEEIGDDSFLTRATSRLQMPVRTVLPSLVQHLGYKNSLLGTSGKVGRYERTSAVYDPTFDPATVDWEAAFASPLRDKTRRLNTDGLRGV